MVIRDGSIYVAPPDYHLIVDGRHACLSHGPRERRFRPAAHGLTLIKQAGGCAIVQDPAEAAVRTMPVAIVENIEPRAAHPRKRQAHG